MKEENVTKKFVKINFVKRYFELKKKVPIKPIKTKKIRKLYFKIGKISLVENFEK